VVTNQPTLKAKIDLRQPPSPSVSLARVRSEHSVWLLGGICTWLAVCVFISAVPITKLFVWGEGDSGGHVLRVDLALCRELIVRDIEEILKLLHATCPGVRETNTLAAH